MTFSRFLERMNYVLVPIGMGAILLMMTVVSLNVTGRFFGLPVFGTTEIVELSGVIMVSFILAYTQFDKQNVAATALIDKLSPKLQAITNSLTLFLTLVIVALLGWTGFVRAQEMLSAGEITAIFRVPQAPFRFIWVLGCISLLLVLIGQFIESLFKVRNK
jgi:TRAP-type C4-dicarboxylate transport system permease small subunit